MSILESMMTKAASMQSPIVSLFGLEFTKSMTLLCLEWERIVIIRCWKTLA